MLQYARDLEITNEECSTMHNGVLVRGEEAIDMMNFCWTKVPISNSFSVCENLIGLWNSFDVCKFLNTDTFEIKEDRITVLFKNNVKITKDYVMTRNCIQHKTESWTDLLDFKTLKNWPMSFDMYRLTTTVLSYDNNIFILHIFIPYDKGEYHIIYQPDIERDVTHYDRITSFILRITDNFIFWGDDSSIRHIGDLDIPIFYCSDICVRNGKLFISWKDILKLYIVPEKVIYHGHDTAFIWN